MGMSNVIFGFNGQEVNVRMTEKSVRNLFYDLTGVTILDKEEGEHGNDHSGGDYSEMRQKVQHPTTEQLVELFKRNINNEVGSELIKDTFYHDYSGEWRRILTIIHVKIKDALRAVEISEDGKYEKVRYGKYIKFIFIRNKMKTVTLDHY